MKCLKFLKNKHHPKTGVNKSSSIYFEVISILVLLLIFSTFVINNITHMEYLEQKSSPTFVRNLPIMHVLDYIIHNGDNLKDFIFYWNKFSNAFNSFYIQSLGEYALLTKKTSEYTAQNLLFISCMELVPHDFLIKATYDQKFFTELLENYIEYLQTAKHPNIQKIETCIKIIKELKSSL